MDTVTVRWRFDTRSIGESGACVRGWGMERNGYRSIVWICVIKYLRVENSRIATVPSLMRAGRTIDEEWWLHGDTGREQGSCNRPNT